MAASDFPILKLYDAIQVTVSPFINPLHVIGVFLHILKILEHHRFSVIFRGYRERPVT